MAISDLRSKIGDFAKDIRLNLGSVLTEDSGLNKNQIFGIALSCAYTVKNQQIVDDILAENVLLENEIEAAKSAASIMAMNNIYYRFCHSVSDKNFLQTPAGLRMSVIGKPGVEKPVFELYCLAISAINGCGLCMDSHTKVLAKHFNSMAIQKSIKIAAVIYATSQALAIN